MSFLKRRALIFSLILIALFPLPAALSLGASVTPSFIWDGYPLIAPSAAYTYPSILDKGTSDSWETLQDSLLRFERRESLASAFLEIENHGFSFALRIDLREELYNAVSNTPWTNIPYIGNTEYAVTNAQYPRFAYLKYQNPYFHMSVGRRLFLLGPGEYSFILSPSQPYLDHAVFGLSYSGSGYELKYDFYALSSSNATLNAAKKTGTADTMKTVFIHKARYERENLIIGLSELNLIYDAVPSLCDFTPFVLWHNQYQEEHSNVMIELSAEWKIRALRLWGIYAQDDICLSNERNNLKPTALGFACGFDWQIKPGEAYFSPIRRDSRYTMRENTLESKGGLHFTGSAYWATNWLYNRRSGGVESGTFTGDRYGKIMLPYRYYSSNGGFNDLSDGFYLGFPYGPGTVFSKLALSYEKKDYCLSFYGSLLVRGDITIDSEVDASSKDRWLWLEGDILRVWTLGLDGEWIPFSSWRNLSLTLLSAFSFDSEGRFYPSMSFTLGFTF